MMLRSTIIAAALFALVSSAAFAQSERDTIAAPLRASVTVSSDVVRIGDVVENAGTAAQIAIFRAPDLGTTGSLPTQQLLSVLRAHEVIGVQTNDIREISVTRASRTWCRRKSSSRSPACWSAATASAMRPISR
jgi:flagella basal body P-ring formation protein FlgA